ncbi:hypothetical protein [Methylobacter sp.]|uniref:hypothetical protein n=1 Tax=Methylobacter sp. TaxID=2051955 RepID=UPI002487633F|nr:hypothetical protein [Methylobacter sp.]MDI1277294.1 hypothetical protein [Methylobacter sp.]MDI1357860.1 hypothetical protein [Methylobacter sp.]
MQKHEFKQFAEKWVDAHEVTAGGRVFSQRAMTIIFDALEDYSLEAIFQAIKIHAKKGKFAPVPSDIVEIITERTGAKHIGCEEAWAIAEKSFDEYETVVWTQPIAEARAIASSLYCDGDKVAARMAFKDAYNRIIKTAPEPCWTVTAGFDMARRADAVKQAVQLGRLPPLKPDNHYLVEPPTMTVAALIESAHVKTGKVSPLAQLKLIKSSLLTDGEDAIARREKERLAFDLHKQKTLDRVNHKLNETTTPNRARE